MSIELTFRQQIDIHCQLKNKFNGMSYDSFFENYRESKLELREIPLAIAFNNTFNCGLGVARELSNKYLNI